MPLSQYFADIRAEVDDQLDQLLPSGDMYPPIIHEAMRYSVFAGGKRLRPILAVSACEMVKGNREAALPFACALEMIHTYTLIHDDLPALDDDDLRRGQLTNHKKFGEATAILAGDGLLTHGFQIMTDQTLHPDISPKTLLDVANETAIAIGSMGTIGGQMVDLEKEGAQADIATLEYIHIHKTGKMIVAAARGGAMLGGANEARLEALTRYGRAIGLAFQVVDDILDVVGATETLGKTVGMDARQNKMTYPKAMGLEESRELADRLIKRAIDSLDMFGGKGEHLRELAEYIGARIS